MIRVLFHLLALLALAPSARAALPICAGLPVVGALVKDCSQNTLFVQAGQACLLSVQSQILSTQAQLTAAMAAAGASSSSAQEAQIQASAANIQNMKDSINSLLAQAALARASMVLYAQSFVLPGPTTASEAHSLGLTSFLSTFPCFSDNQNALASVAASLDQQVADLQRASVAAGVITASTQNLGGSLTAVDLGAKGSGVSGSSATPDSGISGSVVPDKALAGKGSSYAKSASASGDGSVDAISKTPTFTKDSTLPDADISALHMTSGVHEGNVSPNEVVGSLVKGTRAEIALEDSWKGAKGTASEVTGSNTGSGARAPSSVTPTVSASTTAMPAPHILELGEPDVALFDRVHRVLRPHAK